eukprot:CAMPEP_0178516264 /NCGR_PEP_ID=MMETSP0696-20121128/25014_1 /TAXON_ID=265572 /ORGANISM="Extubocellulus spinifer, Strain CCMP396" /LENGTH=723 /DNA_ID=CAMNT_0020146515 /DNA_START=60 /DNA_END=2231 /DNA_ORIENTATION=+
MTKRALHVPLLPVLASTIVGSTGFVISNTPQSYVHSEPCSADPKCSANPITGTSIADVGSRQLSVRRQSKLSMAGVIDAEIVTEDDNGDDRSGAAAHRSLPLFLPAAAAACTAASASAYGSPSLSPDGQLRISRYNTTSCCEAHGTAATTGSIKSTIRNVTSTTSTGSSSVAATSASGGTPILLRRRMTSIGRFSMKSETKENPSIPTFFIALSGKPSRKGDGNIDRTTSTCGSCRGMSSGEFESTWMKSEMPSRHPRFHSRVSSQDDRFFQYETEATTTSSTTEEVDNLATSTSENPKAELHKHVTDTVHPASYRTDLRMRIERLLTEPLDLTDKLWEVYVSSGELGASGAISRLKADHRKVDMDIDTEESLLLFRSHHTLADGVSLISALGDLVDEANEIRDAIKAELSRRKQKSRERSFLKRMLHSISKLMWFFIGSIRSILYQVYLLWTTPRNPFEEALGIGVSTTNKPTGRSVSWCDAAPLDEVKAVARSVGPKVTVNDIFVCCVSAAVTRQLEEHRERAAVVREATTGMTEETDTVHPSKSHINVVVPVHLMGGTILPGKGIGNNIGAFVAQVPAHMVAESTAPATDRLRSVHSSLTTVKKSPAPILSYLVARFASDYLPEGLAKRMFRNANANAAVAISNARGWEKKVHINGRTVESTHGFLPLPPGLPCGVVVQSYAGVVSLSVTAEKWAVPDADRFLGWILDEYRQLCEECHSK